MDLSLRRLKQELVSMKEVGDGLHEQMNCMMGALQELKLLQVQAALEQLEISMSHKSISDFGQTPYGRAKIEVSKFRWECKTQHDQPSVEIRHLDESSAPTSSHTVQMCQSVNLSTLVPSFDRSQQQRIPSVTVIDGEEGYSENGSSSTLTAVDCWPSKRGHPTSLDCGNQIYKGLRNVLPDSMGHQPRCKDHGASEETKDWTSSLLSQSRNRQPLVLGDNIFADLVGNWLDLPELDKKGDKNENLTSSSRSQEIYRKFSLTANIFKRFLRSVRPDRDKLLKEKPCWLTAEEKEMELARRSKKGKKQKGAFYLPFRGNTQSALNKVEKCTKVEENLDISKNCTKPRHTSVNRTQSGFDINTAVWV
ncbi:PAK4-inhibitor INKA2 [Microcaecilia unicolor]|uniref:PAK4-inhibitor INKA2 n=1 Tax=Microcaecilia unicolor TaxID=1415580 RepID=A0A6P7ZGV5_9AMPH|nr:PAK4-inhibitor INKA2 [Microcaecilia unicolor]